MPSWSALAVFTALVAALPLPLPAQELKRVAFFYGHPLPLEALSQFEQVVVDPANTTAADLKQLAGSGTTAFAYVSVGECNRTQPCSSALDRSWVLGSNDAWNSDAMDPLQEGWRNALLDQFAALWNRGFRGFFLDTIDSFTTFVRDDAATERWSALASLIVAVHERFPSVRLITNRGFELLPRIAPLLTGVAAESLFQSWDAAKKQYVEVPESQRVWLSKQLLEVRDRYHLEAIAIDYVPTSERTRARETVRRIARLGIVPWVTTPHLDTLGLGTVEFVPRRLLLLYDGASFPSLGDAPVHRYAALPLEYLGYALDYRDVRQGLSADSPGLRYAGVVTWFTADLPDELGYATWLLRTIDSGIPVVALGKLGTSDPQTLARLGLARSAESLHGPTTITHHDSFVGFEAQPRPRLHDVMPWHDLGTTSIRHLSLHDAQGDAIDAVSTTPWGGLALDPFVLETGYEGRQRWILDPFAFFSEALHQTPFPVPDITTESGRRVLTVQVEGSDQTLNADLLRRHLVSSIPSARLPYAFPPFVEDTPAITNVVAHGLNDGRFAPYFPGRDLDSHAPDRWHLTEAPRRLAPIGLAVDARTASSPGARQELDDVLRLLASFETIPLDPVEYARRATDFEDVTVLRKWDGSWELRNLGAIHTVRLDRSLGWPNLAKSTGLAGVRDLPQGRYVALAGSNATATLILALRPTTTGLVSSDGIVSRWETSDRATIIALSGRSPIHLSVASPETRCRLTVGDRSFADHRSSLLHTFLIKASGPIRATLTCP